MAAAALAEHLQVSQGHAQRDRRVLVLVCAGWNAESKPRQSYAEALACRTASEVRSYRDLLQWASENVDVIEARLRLWPRSLPKRLVQTYCREDDNVKTMMAARAGGLQRTLYLDDDCERFMLNHCGAAGALQWRDLQNHAHRADLFRYAELWFNGGIYVDMKSSFLVDIWEWLEARGLQENFVSCIGERGAHIHQGFISVPPRHPLIREQLLEALTVKPSIMAKSYMKFCRYLYQCVFGAASASFGRLMHDKWGPVHLLREVHHKHKKTVDTPIGAVPVDGHIVEAVGDAADGGDTEILAVRCWGWRHGFEGDRDILPRLQAGMRIL